MRAEVLVAGSGIGFVVQGVALLPLGAGWAGAYDVSGGDCGYDGTCSDAHSLSTSVLGWLVLVGVEAVVGAIAAWMAVRRGHRGSAHAGGFADALLVRGAVAVLIGCVAAWALLAQAAVVSHLAVAQHPGIDAAQGRFFITWNARAMAVESAVALSGWLGTVGVRRSRAKRRGDTAGASLRPAG